MTWRLPAIRAAVGDLMDRMPRTFDDHEPDPVVSELHEALERMDWVREARVRLREEGHVYAGEAFVVPVDEEDLLDRCARAREELMRASWKLQDLVIVPMREDDREGDEPWHHDRSGTAPSPSGR